jgi:hypothetical protein
MSSLLLSLIREGATLFIGREIEKRIKQRLASLAVTFAILAVLGAASLTFLYIFAFDAIAAALDRQSAAAILCGANLLLIALILIGRTIAQQARRRRVGAVRPLGIAGLTKSDTNEALALGVQTAKRLRKMAPEAAIVAAVLGLAIGARPELLDLLKPRRDSRPRDTKTRA